MWYCLAFIQYRYYHDFVCSWPSSRLRNWHRHIRVQYIDTTNITVLIFVLYCLVFIQYSYYCDLFCLGPASRLLNCHCHVWVIYIHTKKIMVVCMSLLILYIVLQRFCYFVMFYFKLTNDTMVKWWMFKWCNVEIKNSTDHLFSHKYWICSFVLFLNTTFSQQTKQFIIFNNW